MERRYLVAALAIIATFTGLSRGFHSLQRMSFDHSNQENTFAAAKCWANSAAQTVAKVRAHFGHGYPPEEAQLLAEMNMPAMQNTISEQMARQDADIARRARERALEQVERAQREAERMHQEMSRVYAGPIAVHVGLPADFERQTAAATAQLAVNQVKFQMATEKFADIQIPAIDVTTDTEMVAAPKIHCKVKVSRHSLRDDLHGFQYGLTSK